MSKTWDLSTTDYIAGSTSADPGNPTSVGSGVGTDALLEFSWTKSFDIPAGTIKKLGLRFRPTTVWLDLPFRISYSYGEMVDHLGYRHITDLGVSWAYGREPVVPLGVTWGGSIIAEPGWHEEHQTYVVGLTYQWHAYGFGQQHQATGFVYLFANGSVDATGQVWAPLSAVVPDLGTYRDKEAREAPGVRRPRDRRRAVRLEPETVAAALAAGDVQYPEDDGQPGERIGGAHVDVVEKVQEGKESEQPGRRRAERADRPAPSVEDLLDKENFPWRFDVEKNAWFMEELEVGLPTVARSIRNYNRLAEKYGKQFVVSDLNMMTRLLEVLPTALLRGGDRVNTLGEAASLLLENLTGQKDKGKERRDKGEGENAEEIRTLVNKELADSDNGSAAGPVDEPLAPGWRPEDFLVDPNPLVLTLPNGIDLWPGADGDDRFVDRLQEYNKMARRNWDLFDPQGRPRKGNSGSDLGDVAMNGLRSEARSVLTAQVKLVRGCARDWVHKDVLGAAVVEVLNRLSDDGKPIKPLVSEQTMIFVLYAAGDVQRRFHTFDELHDAFTRAEIAIPGVMDQLRTVMASPKKFAPVRIGTVVGDAIFGSDTQSIEVRLDATYDDSTSVEVLDVLTESRGACFYAADRGNVLLSADREFSEYDGTVIKLLKFAGWQTGEIRRVPRLWPNKDYFKITRDAGGKRDEFDGVAKFIKSQERYRDRETKRG